MKILKIFIIVILVVLALAAAGTTLFLKTFQVNRYKDRIETELSELSGRTVQLGRIDLGLSLTGVILDLANMMLKDGSGASADNIVSIGRVKVNVDPSALWTRKEIHVPLILVRDLRLHLVRDQNGEFNVVPPDSGSSSSPLGAEPQTKVPSVDFSSGQEEPIVIPPIRVDAITFENGRILFEDRSETFPMAIDIRNLQVRMTDFSLTDPFPFRVQLSLWSDKDNLQVSGQVALNIEQQMVHMKDCTVSTDLGDLNMKTMAEALPVFASAPLEGAGQGQVKVVVRQLSAGSSGLRTLKVFGELKEGAAALPYRDVALSHVLAQFDMDENDIRLKNFSGDVAGGHIAVQGTIRDYSRTQTYTMTVRTDGVALADVLPDVNSEVHFQGDIESLVEISGQGFQYPGLMDHLSGRGHASLVKGRLENFNMMRVILGQLNILPNLVPTLEARLPEKYRGMLTRKDTVFTAAGVDLLLESGTVRINPVELLTDYFSLTGEGDLDTAYNLTFSSAITLSPELSASIVEAVEEFAAVQGEDNRIRIPLQRFQGPVQEFRLFPDMKDLGSKVILKKGETELKKFLDKVIDVKAGDRVSPPLDGQPLSEGEPPQEEKSLEKQLDGVLNSIFGEGQ